MSAETQPHTEPVEGSEEERTRPHLIGRVGTTTMNANGEPRAVYITSEVHYDMYEDELGDGTPVYDAWAIEDDKTGADPDAHYENLGLAAEASAQGRGFRTPAGRPASNELWRFRVRGCQDCWAALFFFGLLVVVVLWGAAELHHLSLTPEMIDTMCANLGLAKPSDVVGHGNGEALAASQDIVVPAPSLLESLVPSAKGKARGKRGDTAEGEIPKEVTLRNIVFSGQFLQAAARWLTWGAVCFAVALGGLTLVQLMPRYLIVLECWVQFALAATLGLLACLLGNLFGAILFAALAAFPLLWLYLVQDRIPFAVCLMQIATRLVKKHVGLVVVAAGIALALILYAALTLFLLTPPILRTLAEVNETMDAAYVLVVIFALLWVYQVLVGIVHVTVAGVVATWYFAGDSHMPDAPVRASFRRATTSSLGSICFGSLFVATVRFLRFLANAARGGDNKGADFIGCVCDCFLSLVEALLRYFNTYAFVHVAIYGCSYIDAARRTWALTQQCFFAAIFNDCLVYGAMDILALMLAVGVAAVGGLVCRSWALALGLAVASFFVNNTVFQIVRSAATTIFVCFAEVPEGLELSFPELYEQLKETDSMGGLAGVNTRGYGTM